MISFPVSSPLVDLSQDDSFLVDLRYASDRNLVGRNVYGAFNRLVLHELAATKLRRAALSLKQQRPDLRLLVLDGLRPNHVQRIFWDLVCGTEQQMYVADPAIGSIHGYGFAVDLTLACPDGRELDMGTPFDDLTPLAEPRLEENFGQQGLLSAAQLNNRHLLRAVMVNAGFIALPIEWWHFDALPAEEVRSTYPLLE